MDAYTLVANKPKLKKADPTSRTRCQEGMAPDAKGDKKCRSGTWEAGDLPERDYGTVRGNAAEYRAGCLRTNVVDATGLEGGYDFTFSG